MTSQAVTPGINVYRMMQRLGIDAAAGVVDRFGITFACAMRTCATCDCSAACGEWIDGTPSACRAPPFCPNGQLLFELMYDVRPFGASPTLAPN